MKMKKIFLVVMILSSFLYSTIYEDAEDGSVNRWVASFGATVNNVVDGDTSSKVIQLSSSSYKYYRMDSLANNSDKEISWDIKADSGFIIYVYVSTLSGNRLLYYTIQKKDFGVTTSGIHHGLGEGVADGAWHTITRDLEAELKESEPNNQITAINSFKIRATGDIFVDNIGNNSSLDTTPPVIILHGNASETVSLNGAYTEQGATAIDVVDGVVAVTITGTVDTATMGSYTITYSATDSAGNSATKDRIVNVIQNGNCLVIEDAEDGNIDGWGASAGATVTNVVDSDTGSNVIQLSSSVYKYYQMENLNRPAKGIKWDIKADSGFIVYVYVSTLSGDRLLYYTILNRNYSVTSSGIHHGLGEGVADGAWHTITRDLDFELKKSEPNNQVTAIKSFKIRATGNVFVDNIEACNGSSPGLNTPPIANAGTDKTVVMSNGSVDVQLDGSGSSDPDGDAITYSWSFVSEPAGSTATLNDFTAVNPTFTATVVGNYILQLIVNDGQVDSVADTVTVTITDGIITVPVCIDPTTLTPKFD